MPRVCPPLFLFNEVAYLQALAAIDAAGPPPAWAEPPDFAPQLAAAKAAGDAASCAALKAAIEAQGKRGAALGKDDFAAAEAHDAALGKALDALRAAELAPKTAHGQPDRAAWCVAELEAARAAGQARRGVALQRALDAHALKEAAMATDDFATAVKHAADFDKALAAVPVSPLYELLITNPVLRMLEILRFPYVPSFIVPL